MADKKQKFDYKTFWTIFIIAIISRFLIVFISYIANKSNMGLFAYIKDVFSIAGDSPHYLKIATNWYATSGDDAKYIVFYPLYPIAIKILSYVFIDKFVSGIVISNVCFGISAYVLYKLSCIEFDSETSVFTLILLMVFPFGIFFFGVFTESLFIMLSLLCMYNARKNKWLLSSLFAFFAALTRVQGVLLLVFMGYEYLLSIKDKGDSFTQILKNIKLDILYFLMPILGFFLYLTINKVVQGSFFAFKKHLSSPPWWQTLKWIGDNILQQYNMGIQYPALAFIIYFVQIVLFIFVMGIILHALLTKMRTSYIAYTIFYMTITFLSGWMISGARYVMGCVSIYFLIANIKNKYVKLSILMIFSTLLVFYSILFMQKQAIM